MIIKHHKGKHWPGFFTWLRQLGPFNGTKAMERIVEFDITAKYDLAGTADDKDVNKLFGFGYINGFHHKDSARFGWVWDPDAGKVTIYAYVYNQGLRSINRVCEMPLNTKIRLCISPMKNRYVFTAYKFQIYDIVIGGVEVPFVHNKKWAYKLVSYFGGNNPAPHDITIKISKK